MVPGDDVVQVADRGVAVRGAAGVVPDLDEAAEPGREEPGAGVHGDEFAGAGGGVEPAEPDVQGMTRSGVGVRVVVGLRGVRPCRAPSYYRRV